jgi:hypothetical protein
MLPHTGANPLSYHLPFDAWRGSKVAKQPGGRGVSFGKSEPSEMLHLPACVFSSFDRTGIATDR